MNEEPASFFSMWAIAIQSQMKRALHELFKHGGSPFTEKSTEYECSSHRARSTPTCFPGFRAVMSRRYDFSTEREDREERSVPMRQRPEVQALLFATKGCGLQPLGATA